MVLRNHSKKVFTGLILWKYCASLFKLKQEKTSLITAGVISRYIGTFLRESKLLPGMIKLPLIFNVHIWGGFQNNYKYSYYDFVFAR